MKIEAVRIQSFKSFADSGWIELSKHFNILVGQNNAGKSAFLQVFNPDSFSEVRHRSELLPEGSPAAETSISFRLRLESGELFERALHRTHIDVPTTQAVGVGIVPLHFEASNTYVLERGEGVFNTPGAPTFGLFDDHQQPIITAQARINKSTRKFEGTTIFHQSPNNQIRDLLTEAFTQTTFLFNAERYSIGLCAMDYGHRLSPDARNLPYMLLKLNKDHRRMEQFQALVSEVLPSIKRILVSAFGAEVELSVQSHSSMRQDLAVPLNQSGTGVAQVLAILYVVVAYPAAQIVIDEPNSFLHPAATRRLLNVLRRFEQHQFLLSTHAADVIAVSRPENLLLLQWDEQQSQTIVTSSSGEDVNHVRASLNEIGVSLSDVFGYDVVVFVEGPTERSCFPLLLPPDNTTAINFVAMREASALTSANPQALFDIYSNGVASTALLPPVTLFSFDCEGRSEQQRADVLRASKGTARFLPRPMFESYLLHPDALSSLLGELDGGRAEIAPEVISRWIAANYQKYRVKGIENESPATCDAARLLDVMFLELTEARYEYRKVEYGQHLTDWLLANDPGHLAELADYIRTLVKT